MIPIAIYHCSIKIVSRGKGKSAVAAAAYRAGEKLTNEWDGLTHDYTRKGGVVHSEILLPPQAPGLADLLMKYLSVQREKSRKYSQRWQQQHTADELKTIAAAVNYLSEHGISNLDELDASLSSVSDKAYSIREGMKTAEQRMKELQKLMEYGRNYQTYKPIQDEYRQIRWKGKQEKFAEARRAELTLWDAANRYLHAHLPEGVKTLPISAWEKEYTALKAQREAEYETLKDTRAEVAELQKIRRCVDIALRADQPEQTQNRTKRHDIDR